MTKSDLSLIPTDDLIEEIRVRHTAYVLATLRTETGNEPVVRTYWSDNKFIDCLGICSALEEDLKSHYMRDDKE